MKTHIKVSMDPSSGTSVPDTYAVQGDGNDYLSIADNASLQMGASDFTIECWYKNTATPGGWEVLARKDTAYTFQIYGVGGDKILLIYHHNGTAWVHWGNSGPSLWDGAWHHLAGTFKRSTGKGAVFADGVLLANNYNDPTDAADTAAGTTLAVLAVSNGTEATYGAIDEMRISKVLRYTGNFSVATAPFDSDANTAALWHFGEGTGTTAADSSTNANTLTFAGAPNDPEWVTGYVW